MTSIDLMIDRVSGDGKYQMLLICLAFYANIASALNIVASLFTAGVPDLRCFIPGIDDIVGHAAYSLDQSQVVNFFVPYDESKQAFDYCHRKNFNATDCWNESCWRNKTDFSINTCEDGYVYDTSIYKSTVVTEWNVVCSNEIYITLSTSLFYVGFFFGAVIGGLVSDRLGRVFTYRIGAFGGLVFGVAAAFSPNFVVFSTLRIFQVFMFYQSTLASIVYGVEISKGRWRTMSGLMCNGVFGAGCILLSLVAYFIRKWRLIQIVISSSFLISIVITFFLPPSPRWLCSKKRYKEAERVLRKMATRNHARFDDKTWTNLIKSLDQKEEDEKLSTLEILKGLMSRYYSRCLVLCNMLVWMITSLVYFGLILNSGNIGVDVYLSNALGGLMELSGCVLSVFVSGRVGCKSFITFNLVLSSLACLVSTVVIQCGSNLTGARTIALVTAMFGRFGASSAFGTLFLETMELFPTCARTTALGLASMAARIGSIISPWTVQAQRAVPWLGQAIFGVTTLLAALMVSRFPETRNAKLTTTFDEAESMFKAHYSKTNRNDGKEGWSSEEEMKSLQAAA